MKKAVGIFLTIIILFVVVGGVGYFIVWPKMSGESSVDSANLVYVSKVDDILNGFSFTANRYSGVVETQEVISVEADLDKKIKTTFVKEGDEVKKGDKLFEYDVDEMQIQLDQYKLDIEQTESEIKDYNEQIESLEKEKKTASANKQLSLSNQIDSAKLNLKKAEYSKQSTEKNIEKLQKSIENAVITSTVDGTVQTVNDPTVNAYVTIASNGDFRIKATVSENNIFEFYEDEEIIIRSRVNDNIKWSGKVTSVDTAKPINDTNVYGNDTTTKYPVYISIDNTDGLLIGQHVTVEADYGLESDEIKEGIWLSEIYISYDDDSSPYVWAEGDNKTIEKRSVTLGEYDEDMMKYEIVSGITEEDYIAFPESRVTEGMTTTYNAEDIVYEEDSFGDFGDIEGLDEYDIAGEEDDMIAYDEDENVIAYQDSEVG